MKTTDYRLPAFCGIVVALYKASLHDCLFLYLKEDSEIDIPKLSLSTLRPFYTAVLKYFK